MKLNKQMIIILGLVSLLFSALGSAYYFYNKNEKTMLKNKKVIFVYAAKEDIKKHTLITEKHLKKIKMQKKYLLSTALVKTELIDKYTTENMYQNDIFRKEKIAKKIVKDDENLVDNFKFNSYNINFTSFRNPNYSLKKGDYISIISAYQVGKENRKMNSHDVQYIAKNIKVLGFMRNGKETDTTIKKMKVTRKVKKKTVTEMKNIKADEIILDITSDVALSLTDDYNRGKWLWMIKTLEKDQNILKPIKKSNNQQIKKKKVYPIRLYKPKRTYKTLKASIHYENSDDLTTTATTQVETNDIERCNKSDNFLIVTSSKVSLRRGLGIKYKIMRTINKNNIIPYIKKDGNWYRTCDDLYVHKAFVETIDKDVAFKKLGKKL